MRVASLLMLVIVSAGCANTAFHLSHQRHATQDDDDQELRAMSPSAYVERFGEPNEWTSDGEGANIRITAVWRCVEGEHRTVVWKQLVTESGGRAYWNVVQEEVRDGDCDD